MYLLRFKPVLAGEKTTRADYGRPAIPANFMSDSHFTSLKVSQ
jgi:hypothetical protein